MLPTPRLKVTAVLDGGWVVELTVGPLWVGYFYGPSGGEWALLPGGAVGRLIVAPADIVAPRARPRFERWVRRRLTPRMVRMQDAVEMDDRP